MTQDAFVYFMTNRSNSVLYIGVTNDLIRRVAEHKLGTSPGFTSRYNCHKLVYFETGDSITAAIAREKQLKKWERSWKNRLVNQVNPGWNDLSERIGVTGGMLDQLSVRRSPPSRG
jgi:putative endonuclease